MMIISLSWRCHVVMCSCHKLLMSRKLSRGCVTCCPDHGPMCTGSDAPLVTPRLSLRMRGSDQQVVARARPRLRTASLRSPHIATGHTHTPRHILHSVQKKRCEVPVFTAAVGHQIDIWADVMFHNTVLYIVILKPYPIAYRKFPHLTHPHLQHRIFQRLI